MALPHLLKFAYNHGTEEVVRRGKKIHAIGFAELVEHDELMGTVVFRVRDDSYAKLLRCFSYRIWLTGIFSASKIFVTINGTPL